MYLVKLASILFMLSFFTACNQAKSTQEELLNFASPWAKDKTNTNPCSVPLSQGETFQSGTTQIVGTPFLNKQYPHNLFESALRSSPSSFINFLHSSKVMIFKIADGSGCQYFGELNEAPQNLSNIWHQETSKVKGNKLKIMGLFFAEYAKNSQHTTLSKKAIMLRSTASKWHLIHESMHYFFAQERVKGDTFPYPDDLLKKIESTQKLKAKYIKNISSNPTPDSITKWIKAANEHFELSKLNDARTSLEEFMIESMLIDAFVNNKISEVDIETVYQSYGYMQSQYQKVRPIYVDLQNEVANVLTTTNDGDAKKLLLKIEKFINELDQSFLSTKEKISQLR